MTCDPTKTIAAPYSQGNVEVLDTANAGTQCVAISLSALGYSALSQSCKRGLLLLTDLPVMVNLCDINYQLTYSESYSSLLNSTLSIIADFPYVTLCQLPLIFGHG